MATATDIAALQQFIQDTAEKAVTRVFSLTSGGVSFTGNWSGTSLATDLPVFQPINVPPPMAPSAMTGGVNYQGIATWMEERVDAMYRRWFPQSASVIEALEEWTLEVLQGITGLGLAAENALFTAVRDRAYKDGRRAVQTAVDGLALRGFPLPTGAVASALREADAAGRESLIAANRDILVEAARVRADMVKTAASIANDMYQSMRTAPIDLMKTYAQLPALDADAKRAMASALEAYYSSLTRYAELQVFDETKNFEVLQFKLNHGLERDKLKLQGQVAQADILVRQRTSATSAMGDVAGSALSAQNALLAVISNAEGA